MEFCYSKKIDVFLYPSFKYYFSDNNKKPGLFSPGQNVNSVIHYLQLYSLALSALQ